LSTNIKEDIHRILKKYWYYDSFRPLQEEIITSVVEGKDTLALLPTGGGKSVCFQVPGILMGGTCLVISPLISLMHDQVQNLKKKGISAVAISSAMSFKEIEIALNNAALGHVQFLYVSPERLQNDEFKKKLSFLPITLIAVDEAHCISQWGYDFRPSYMKIADLRSYFNKVTFIALTASATPPVVEDIQDRLEFKTHNVFRQTFARKNLRYVVQQEENKIPRLVKLIANIGGSGIVYVRNRKKTEELSKFLNANKVSAMAYHAGLKYDARGTVQQQWIENKVQVICATNAFGMGIDKPDVRFVVHLDLPDTLEAYFQEAGRGGRDGNTAYATVFFTKADQLKLEESFTYAFPEINYIKQTYQAICNYYQVAIDSGEGLSFEFDIDKVCKSYNLLPVLVYNSIKFLEKDNYLSLLDTGFEPSKVMMQASKEDIYEFQVRFPKYEPLVKTLLRSYGGLFENYVFINEKDLAYRAKTNTATVVEYLQLLDKQKLLSYIPQTSLPKIIFLQNRVNAKFIEFNPENYTKLKELYREKINAVIGYTNNNKVCRQVQLLLYFGEKSYSDCGFCDVCIGKKPKGLEKIKEKIIKVIEKQPVSLDDLKNKMQTVNDKTWITAFNELVDDNVLRQEGDIVSLRKKAK
jgi:ATP-dependent DNA helicase RecQ